MNFDVNNAQAHGKGNRKTKKDIARALALMGEIQKSCEEAGLFKGMTPEQILEQMRRTREELWRETHAAAR